MLSTFSRFLWGRQASSVALDGLILGLDTSCDETSAAVVGRDGRILSNVVRSQWEIHSENGGISPIVAKDAHVQMVSAVIEQAIAEARAKDNRPLSGIAVTTGPGLVPCLRVGANAAAELANRLHLPLYHINHLEGHVLTPRLVDPQLTFPFLSLLASGGHTQFVLCEGVGNYVLLGGTMDDALGEAFDKVARILGLPFYDFETGLRSAATLERLALSGDAQRLQLPRPLDRRKKCGDMSFSGLKSCVARIRTGEDNRGSFSTADLAAAFQETAFAHVCDRLRFCLSAIGDRSLPPLTGIAISGGVAANQCLRNKVETIAKAHAVPVLFPPMALCSDNGAMIAWVAHERIDLSSPIAQPAPAEPPVYARWSLDPNHPPTAQFTSSFAIAGRTPTSKPWKHRQSTSE